MLVLYCTVFIIVKCQSVKMSKPKSGLLKPETPRDPGSESDSIRQKKILYLYCPPPERIKRLGAVMLWCCGAVVP